MIDQVVCCYRLFRKNIVALALLVVVSRLPLASDLDHTKVGFVPGIDCPRFNGLCFRICSVQLCYYSISKLTQETEMFVQCPFLHS